MSVFVSFSPTNLILILKIPIHSNSTSCASLTAANPVRLLTCDVKPQGGGALHLSRHHANDVCNFVGFHDSEVVKLLVEGQKNGAGRRPANPLDVQPSRRPPLRTPVINGLYLWSGLKVHGS